MTDMLNDKSQKFRHEFKYVVSAGEIELIKNRIAPIMKTDSYADPNTGYVVRSLYFDDYYNRCFYENQNGTDPREKYRIRIYNASSERILLECKRKERGKTLKTSCLLTVEQAQSIMQGKPLSDFDNLEPLLKKFTLLMLTDNLRPVIIVEYRRIPFIYENGNVRITLDTDISSSNSIDKFLEEQIAKRPVMPTGKHLLEVKYDEYLPDHIYQGLQLENLSKTAYSKYYMSRKYTL